jgi:hypothetical protein
MYILSIIIRTFTAIPQTLYNSSSRNNFSNFRKPNNTKSNSTFPELDQSVSISTLTFKNSLSITEMRQLIRQESALVIQSAWKRYSYHNHSFLKLRKTIKTSHFNLDLIQVSSTPIPKKFQRKSRDRSTTMVEDHPKK